MGRIVVVSALDDYCRCQVVLGPVCASEHLVAGGEPIPFLSYPILTLTLTLTGFFPSTRNGRWRASPRTFGVPRDRLVPILHK